MNGQNAQINAKTDLPPEMFQLTDVILWGNQKFDAVGFANFKGCKNLVHLHLGETPVTDSGLNWGRSRTRGTRGGGEGVRCNVKWPPL